MFLDRKEAGQQLAQKLKDSKIKNPYVFGMARGGVPVAFEVAKELEAPLDVVVVRKIGFPSNPEFGIGAIAQGGIKVYNQEIIKSYQVDPQTINKIIQDETKELNRRLFLYRESKPLPDLKNKTAILVDDGLATGISALAAVKFLRTLGLDFIVLAVPVGALDSVQLLEKEVDKVICLLRPNEFSTVGQWYNSFEQTTDDEVINILTSS